MKFVSGWCGWSFLALTFASVTGENLINVHFYGLRHIDQNSITGLKSLSVNTLRDLIGHLVGVKPSNYKENENMISKLVGHQERHKSVVVFLTHDPVTLTGTTKPSFTSDLTATDCASSTCISRTILSKAHERYPLTSVELNRHTSLVLLSPNQSEAPSFVEQIYLPSLVTAGVSHVTLEGFGKSSGSLDLNVGFGEPGIPPSLRKIISYTSTETSSTITLLHEVPSLPKQLIIKKGNKCLKGLITELSLTAASLNSCISPSTFPSVCVIDPTVARKCFENDKELKPYGPFVSHIFGMLAQQLSFKFASTPNERHLGILIEGSISAMGNEEWDPASAILSLDTRPAGDTGGTDYYSFFAGSGRKLAAEEDDKNSPTTTPTAGPSKLIYDQDASVKRHIILWTSVASIVAVYFAIYSIHAMTSERDPMLFTKVSTAS